MPGEKYKRRTWKDEKNVVSFRVPDQEPMERIEDADEAAKNKFYLMIPQQQP